MYIHTHRTHMYAQRCTHIRPAHKHNACHRHCHLHSHHTASHLLAYNNSSKSRCYKRPHQKHIHYMYTCTHNTTRTQTCTMYKLTHLLLDYAAERKRHICTIHINHHQSTLHPFFLWAIVDDFVFNAWRKSSTADFLLALFCGLSYQCQEIIPYDLQGINYITTFALYQFSMLHIIINPPHCVHEWLPPIQNLSFFVVEL